MFFYSVCPTFFIGSVFKKKQHLDDGRGAGSQHPFSLQDGQEGVGALEAQA